MIFIGGPKYSNIQIFVLLPGLQPDIGKGGRPPPVERVINGQNLILNNLGVYFYYFFMEINK